MTRKSVRGAFETDPLWYKDAVIYEVHVRAFCDSNGDGIGDFAGLTGKLDYLQDLGVNTIWVLPFYPSPGRDDGYDIADYVGIHPDYGTGRDFRHFVRAAHDRGLRVITELVINHTSDAHPWFQAARRAPPGSAKRAFYVWSDTAKKFENTRVIFTDSEKSNWTWDDVAHAYYWHRFFFHQPDLNHNNPQVVKAVIRVMRYWLDQGVDGLRLDALPYLCVREGTSNENLPETHAVTRHMRAVIDAHYEDRMVLAEANQWPEDVRDYFGDGDEVHMAYHFPLMPRMYMAIAQEDRHPVVEIMKQTPDIPSNCQWAIFLRNHDELTLEMVTNGERDYMYRMYGAEPKSRLNLGIRRRLAPLMDNDFDKIRLMNSLLLSMPGSPIIYYGDEIGMGDNIFLGDRNGVRTPMQWSPDRNGGFSRADPQRLFLPLIMDPVYGYEAVNVEAQARDPSSLLNWMRRLLTVRRSSRAFGRGALDFLEPGNRRILAYLRTYENEIILCVANLARSAQPVELDLRAYKGYVPVELMGRAVFPPIGTLPYLLTLHGHGFYWFRLAQSEEVPAWHEERLAPEELPLLVLFDGWRTLFQDKVVPWRATLAGQVRKQFEDEALPRFMQKQRWYGAKNRDLAQARLAVSCLWGRDGEEWLLALMDVACDEVATCRYFVPLALLFEKEKQERREALMPFAVARVRRQADIGLIGDAMADPDFCRAMLQAARNGESCSMGDGVMRWYWTGIADPSCVAHAEDFAVRPPSVQSSNSVVTLGGRLFLKCYRQLQEGVNPEREMGQFLAEVAGFDRIVPIFAYMDYVNNQGQPTSLAILQPFVENQGDAWDYTVHYLEKYLDLAAAGNVEEMAGHGAYATFIETLGRRTGEMHRALAQTTGDPAFDPEAIRMADVLAWRAKVDQDIDATISMLSAHSEQLPEAGRDLAIFVVSQAPRLHQLLGEDTPLSIKGLRTRTHGDYHLGQVLVTQNDFVIIDFEGEPTRSFAERRRKYSPLRDVAGLLRSLNYAAYTASANVRGVQELAYGELSPLMRAWEEIAAGRFLSAYEEASAGSSLWPSFAEARSWLRLLMLEKALYELRYEIEKRPQWVHVPLRGLADFVEEHRARGERP